MLLGQIAKNAYNLKRIIEILNIGLNYDMGITGIPNYNRITIQ